MTSNKSRKREERYVYEKLGLGNLIRVLYLDAARSKDDPLRGRLGVIDLDTKFSHSTRLDTADETNDHGQTHRDRPSYEALSWCWGAPGNTEILDLRDEKDITRSIYIPSNLAKALKCLRPINSGQPRVLWVDAICIDLSNHDERAHQVAQMNLVYGRAKNVCVWLDDDTPTGIKYGLNIKEVFAFVRDQFLDPKNFDSVIANTAYNAYWLALVQLMTKQWFSRRWVIQEIALARAATIHCGDATMGWKAFANAVSLFVKAQSSNQLSKIIAKDKTWSQKQGLFWDIDRMGAVSLVEMTTANFYNPARGIKQPVSTLESLMSMLSMFESSKACDTIYALLAIAKDTTPEAEGFRDREIDYKTAHRFAKKFKTEEEGIRKLANAKKAVAMLAAGLRSKPYVVSYSKPAIDVYKDFIEFCIYQSRSLDIICRPWAPKPERNKEENRPSIVDEEEGLEESYPSSPPSSSSSDSDYESPTLEWRIKLNSRIGKSLTSLNPRSPYPESTAFGTKRSMSQTSFDSDRSGEPGFTPTTARSRRPADRPIKKQRTGHVPIPQARKHDLIQEMPSWIADRKRIAFLLLSADNSTAKMERMNADPLVGSPDLKPYTASGTRQVRMGSIRFLRRGEYDQSLFVEGFILDQVEALEQPSLSNIPPSWFEFVDYDSHDSTKKSPPTSLYRTLIADRGPKGTRPPPYYWLAYKEVLKNTITSLKIEDGMKEGRSIITEFLQRVQQVTFNRCLIKTTATVKAGKNGASKPRLGLAPKETLSRIAAGGGDLVCIFYGLSVPVILRRFTKTSEEKEADRIAREEQLPEAYRTAVRTIEKYWSFMKALKTALYMMKDDWPPYRKEMPKWRKDIKGKFSRLWLEKIDADFKARHSRSQQQFAPASQNGHPKPRPPALKKNRLSLNQSPQEKKEQWEYMCREWRRMLKSKDGYPLKSDNVIDKPIAISTEEHDCYYKVIGECYLDQMMDGEALEYKRTHPEMEDIVFELR